MAALTVEGSDIITDAMKNLSEIPGDVKLKMLEEMGNVCKDAEYREGQSMNIWDPNWEGKHVLESLSRNEPQLNKNGDGGGYVTVTFSGTRHRGKKDTRNAEIAFINNYGANDRGIAPKPFVTNATEKHAEEIQAAGEKIFDDWVDDIY